MPTPRITMVVVPRERFSAAFRSLDSLLEATAEPYELIHVSMDSPRQVRLGTMERLAGRQRRSSE